MCNILLVDENDSPLGTEEKLKVHKEGLLHRAFSIFVVNSKGELLLQKRALCKYHSPGLWTNTCCSHPEKNEVLLEFIKGRLNFEMGFVCDLRFLRTHRYRAKFENGLIENELDHVYVGSFEGLVVPNPEEVSDYKWEACSVIAEDLERRPDRYTVWFREIFPRFMEYYNEVCSAAVSN